MNATIEKFGHPGTLLAEWTHWVLLLRPSQPTLGSCVLAAKSDATAFGDLPPAAYGELAEVTAAVEKLLRGAFGYDRLNYLMLMMVDPHVHFHVIPRYEGTRHFGTLRIEDEGWPGPPALASALTLDEDQRAMLVADLRGRLC